MVSSGAMPSTGDQYHSSWNTQKTTTDQIQALYRGQLLGTTISAEKNRTCMGKSHTKLDHGASCNHKQPLPLAHCEAAR
jgi:hypothetical protein